MYQKMLSNTLNQRNYASTRTSISCADEEDVKPVIGTCQVFLDEKDLEHWYFHSKIGDTQFYTPLIASLEVKSKGDCVHLHLATHGGDLDTTITIINSIERAKKRGVLVIGHAEGHCISAGTMILFSCSQIDIDYQFTYFLFHDAFIGLEGKLHELQWKINFYRKTTAHIYHSLYTKAFDHDEIEEILEVGDKYHYTSDEIIQRIKARDESFLYTGECHDGVNS